MSTIVTRAGKGSPLENSELDSNFTNLNTDKLEINAALGTPASVTLTNATGLPTAGLVDNAVTDAKLRDSGALSVIGRSANSTGNPADISAGANHQVLRRDGSSLGFGAVDLSSNQAVTGTLPVNQGGTGITSFGAGVATWLGTPSSANLAAAVTDETGTGALVFANSPTLVTPTLGTPASGVVTNLTGTASININGTVGATTPAAGAFTTLSSTGTASLGSTGANAPVLIGKAATDAYGAVSLNNSSTPATMLGLYGSFGDTKLYIKTPTGGGLSIQANNVELAGFTSTGLEVKGKLAVGYSDFSGIPTNGAAFAGSVGIGTLSPLSKLDVKFATNKRALFTASASYSNGADLIASNDSGSEIALGLGGNTVRFYTGATERARINSSGNLGLGVTPGAWGSNFRAIEVAGTGNALWGNTSGANIIVGQNAVLGVDNSNLYYQRTAAASYYQQDAGAHKWLTAPSGTAGDPIAFTQAMTLDASGNLGIGTTSPDELVSISGGNMKFTNTDSDESFIYFTHTVTDNRRSYIGAAEDDSGNGQFLVFASNASGEDATERMRITSAGNVGIGTASPSASAILDAQSTTKGVRMPNMTTTEKNAIASPAAGLMVYDTTLAKLCVYTTAWETITSL